MNNEDFQKRVLDEFKTIHKKLDANEKFQEYALEKFEEIYDVVKAIEHSNNV